MRPYISQPVQYFATANAQPLAAIVTAVGEGSEVNLSIFNDYAGPVDRVTCSHKDDAKDGGPHWDVVKVEQVTENLEASKLEAAEKAAAEKEAVDKAAAKAAAKEAKEAKAAAEKAAADANKDKQ